MSLRAVFWRSNLLTNMRLLRRDEHPPRNDDNGGAMGLLEGKNALIFGLANDKSIAWGITQAFHREGANLGISYAGEMLERRVRPLSEKVGCQRVEECDVSKDDQIAAVVEKAAG